MLKRSKISLMAFISVSLVIIILISLFPNFFVQAARIEPAFNFVNDFGLDDSSCFFFFFGHLIDAFAKYAI